VLTISQKVVPLEIDIQKLGAQNPADASHFSIQSVTAGQAGNINVLETVSTLDDFAPGQFFNRSDTDKLSGKSFEKYAAGVRIQASEDLSAGFAVRRAVNYELFYKDQTRVLMPSRNRFEVDFPFFTAWSVGGAVAQSPLSHARRATSAGSLGRVAVKQEDFSVVFNRDLTPVQPDLVFASQAEAQSRLELLLSQQPGLAGEIQVIPAFEMSRP
jgi:hypothetical protein